MDISENPGENPTTAMSLFGSAQHGGDFPVLKAFQEYIDAEQAKARKRMLGLSIFFVVLLSIVVVTFTLIVIGVINRNQTLSDRLLDVALRQQAAPVQPQPQPVVNVQPAPVAPQPDLKSDLKPVLEKIEQLASAVANQTRQPQPIIQPVMQPMPIIQPTPTVMPAKVDDSAAQAEAARLREELKREKEKMEMERKKLKEAQRQAEVEAHRRRLYPEYYAKKDAEAQAQKQKGNPPLPAVASPSHSSAPKTTTAKIPSQTAESESIGFKPRDYSARATDDDDARIEALAQEVRRRQAAEAKQKKAAADAAEAAQRAAAAEAAAKKSQAEAAEAERKKAAADAEKKKATAAAAEADSRKAAALAAKKQADAIVAEAEREKAEYQRAKAEARMKANAAETLTVKTKDADSVPWIIQRLND